MICRPCREAADLIELMLAFHTYSEDWVEKARDEHTRCHDCDCQHDVDYQVAGRSV